MSNHTDSLINKIISSVLIIAIGVTPLVFSGLTTEFYEIPKLIFLLAITILLVGLWVVSWLVHGKAVLRRTPFDVPLAILLAAVSVSTLLSSSRLSSIYGLFPEVHGSAVSWVVYILVYFLAASHLTTPGRIKALLYALLISAAGLSVVSITSFLGVFLPFDIAQSVNFTPAGSTFSALAVFLLMLPVVINSLINRSTFLPWPAAAMFSVLFSFTIVLTGSVAAIGLLLLAYFAVFVFNLSQSRLYMLFVPFLFTALFIAFAFIPFSGNLIYDTKNAFPTQAQLPINTSWKISAKALADAPFFGTGPSTYLFNFTNYKSVEFNKLEVWNLPFSSAHNEFLEVLATLGLLGFVSLAAACVLVAIYALKNLPFSRKDNALNANDTLLTPLSVSALIAVALLAMHPSSLVSMVLTLAIFAAFAASRNKPNESPGGTSFGAKIPIFGRKVDVLAMLALFVYMAILVTVAPRAYNAVLADYYHRQALQHASLDGLKTYEYLQKAEQLNPFIDLYRVDMAQTNFALANTLASQKGPTTQNPEGTLTEEDKEVIQTLITQAINEGRAAVALSPRSARNWEVLALIYQNITGVANNAIAFALDSYGRAIQLDPLNPSLRVSVGLIYYSIEDYDSAVRFFTDAVNLKPDYIGAYYNLAIALKDKGDLQEARLVAEDMIELLQRDLSGQAIPPQLREIRSQDYSTASELLSQIQNAIEASSAQDPALQNPDLPQFNIPLESLPETTTPPVVEPELEFLLP